MIRTFSTKNKKFVWAVMLSMSVFCIIRSYVLLHAEEFSLVDRIVAVVNNDVITLYDVNRAFRPFEENIKALNYPPEKERQTLFQVRKDILDHLINSKLADQEIKRYQITVSKDEIDNMIERFKESRSITDEQFREGLGQQGMTIEEYRTEVKEQILRAKLVNREVKAKIVITDEDIKAFYESNPEKYAGDKKYHLWNIFVRLSVAGDSSAQSAAQSSMSAILAKLKEGYPFENLVNDLVDSSSEAQGSDLGLFRLEELSNQLQKVVKNMKIGDFTDVLNTDFGYQIIYVQDIVETPAKPIEAVESEIHEVLYNEFVDDKYDEWLGELRERSHIKVIN